MSKAVRIRDHLYAEIEALAKAERRSLIAQLEVLLEQALKIESSGAGGASKAVEGLAGDATRPVAGTPSRDGSASGARSLHVSVPEDPHFKPDFK